MSSKRGENEYSCKQLRAKLEGNGYILEDLVWMTWSFASNVSECTVSITDHS